MGNRLTLGAVQLFQSSFCSRKFENSRIVSSVQEVIGFGFFCLFCFFVHALTSLQ